MSAEPNSLDQLLQFGSRHWCRYGSTGLLSSYLKLLTYNISFHSFILSSLPHNCKWKELIETFELQISVARFSLSRSGQLYQPMLWSQKHSRAASTRIQVLFEVVPRLYILIFQKKFQEKLHTYSTLCAYDSTRSRSCLQLPLE